MLFTTVVFANNIDQLIADVVQFKVIVNGDEKQFEMPIVTIDDRTYIPLRELSETLGMEVEWDEANQTIIIDGMPDENDIKLYPFTFKEDELIGYMNIRGKIVIEPQFTYATEFSEGLAAVKKENSMYGYINTKGEVALPYEYYYADMFSEGVAVVRERRYTKQELELPSLANSSDISGPYIYIDKTGKAISDKVCITARRFNEGYGYVQRASDAIPTFIDRTGNFANQPDILKAYDEASSFLGGYATIYVMFGENRGHGIIDKDMNVRFISNDYVALNLGKDGYITALKRVGGIGIINADNEVILDFQGKQLRTYSEGLIAFSGRKESGYIDINGNVVIQLNGFDWLNEFSNGIAVVGKQGVSGKIDSGVINKEGEFIIEPIYNGILRVGEVFQCRTKTGDMKYFDLDGKEIIPHY